MSTKRKCRECHKPHGDNLAVCVECEFRLGHYDHEQVRQSEGWRRRWGMIPPPGAVSAARQAKRRRQMAYAQGERP